MKINVYNYIQLSLLFTNGFLISRLFLKCGIAEKIVFFFIKKSNGHISRIIIYIIFTTAFLSMFIPNMVSVLTILPILEILRKDFDKIEKPSKQLHTSLAMSSLYGANIGGTGSITGSPASVLLLGFLFFEKVKDANKIDFLSWLGWGIPFVVVFATLACIMNIYFIVPRHLRKRKIDFYHIHLHKQCYVHEKIAVTISVFSFAFWFVISSVNLINKDLIMPYTTGLAIAFFIMFILTTFVFKIHDKKNDVKSRILNIKDCFSNLPGKGLWIIVFIIFLAIILVSLNFDTKIASLLRAILPEKGNLLLMMVIFTTLTIYISEVISNNATAISIFIVATSVCQSMGIHPLPLLLGISLVSTTPMMSPIATPVNAIAYGGIKGVSLKRMVTVGFFMDIISIILVTLLAVYVIPIYYGLN